MAWSNLSGTSPQNAAAYECGSSTYACCSGCYTTGSIPLLSCGSTVCVTNECNNVSELVTVADHGPWCCCCDNFPCGGVQWVNQLRMADMTEATFAYFGNLSQGIIPINVYSG